MLGLSRATGVAAGRSPLSLCDRGCAQSTLILASRWLLAGASHAELFSLLERSCPCTVRSFALPARQRLLLSRMRAGSRFLANTCSCSVTCLALAPAVRPGGSDYRLAEPPVLLQSGLSEAHAPGSPRAIQGSSSGDSGTSRPLALRLCPSRLRSGLRLEA